MSKITYRIKVIAHTPRGEFSGYIGESSTDINQVKEVEHFVKTSINKIESLILEECPDDIGISTTLNKHMMEQSVIQTKIVSELSNK